MHQRRQDGLALRAAVVLLFGVVAPGPARAQTAPRTSADAASGGAPGAGVVDHPLSRPGATPVASGGSDERLTVTGHRSRFQPAPVPGAPMGPPPDKPAAHLGRYKISGDQTKKDGYDTQTGAYIAPFGSAYTGAGPVADGLASRFQH